ncbi:MAG: hypothetical protein PWP38_432 [Clostridiales bacterium]|jgi:methyl-accepting chemotaxis protein|nr:hypothetical protein [Clostridiales bacterium]
MKRKRAFFRKAPCEEAECILQHVESHILGEDTVEPKVEYPIHRNLLYFFKRLFNSEKKLSEVSKDVLSVAVSLSEFDVNMAYTSEKLVHFAEEMAELSESNLAIVEETNASMTQVSTTVTEASETLEHLSASSAELLNQNEEGLVQLNNVMQLKDNVIEEAEIMHRHIQHLIDMTDKVNEIVKSVGDIADQTNLLALNASIEAARAGESGRGFAVVAEEIRKLADSTKQSLEGMNNFVASIKKTAAEGETSMKTTLESTANMSEQITNVSDTLNGNMDLMRDAINGIHEINAAMSGIQISTEEINQAMNASSEDAQKLRYMTESIFDSAKESQVFAENIKAIDDKLSGNVKTMMDALNGGRNALSNEEFVRIIENAIASHKQWMKKLAQITETMTVTPLQTDGNRCGFGHFYKSIDVYNVELSDLWGQIDGIHKTLHANGGKVIAAVKNHQTDEARKYYQESTVCADKIMSIFNEIVAIVKKNESRKIQVFQNDIKTPAPVNILT